MSQLEHWIVPLWGAGFLLACAVAMIGAPK